MPRRFFRKFAIKRHELSQKWFMTPFQHMLHDHRLWGIRRKTVVPAFSLGLFIAFAPLPGHFLIAVPVRRRLRILLDRSQFTRAQQLVAAPVDNVANAPDPFAQ